MNDYPKYAIQPPEKIDTPYAEAVSGPTWPYDETRTADIMAGAWPLQFCTDEECAALSGVPERSLRLLQTASVIHATKAPIGGGSYRRVWHLPEVAAATVIESLKQATKIDYKTAAQISFHVAKFTRMLFVEFVKMKNDASGQLFGANLVLSQNNDIHLQISHAVRTMSPTLRHMIMGNNNVVPIAKINNGRAVFINPDSAQGIKQRERMKTDFEHARFHVAVMLANVFEQFEQQARALRKT